MYIHIIHIRLFYLRVISQNGRLHSYSGASSDSKMSHQKSTLNHVSVVTSLSVNLSFECEWEVKSIKFEGSL